MTDRRGPTRVVAAVNGRLPTISLLVVMIMTTTSASAFSFWSSSMLGKVIKPQARPTAHHQSTGAPVRHSQISTTSSSTTTEMPQPLELHFEINPEGLTTYASDGPEVAWNKSGDDGLSSPSAIANGSLILEDLVNQLARNFQAGELKQHQTASNRTVDGASELAAEPTTPQMSMQLLDAPNHVDSLVEPPAEGPDPDRHIQYDMTNLLSTTTNNMVDSTHQATHQALYEQSPNSSISNVRSTTGQDYKRPPDSVEIVPINITTTPSQAGANHSEHHLSSSLENDTSILDTAMSTSNSSRAPATTNPLQARSMSPGSSGHLSSLSNHRPPPVVGQRPPYASSYQLHHRGALDPSNTVSRDNSSHGANQVAPPPPTTNGGDLTNSINSISSSLLIGGGDSLPATQATTTSSTTTAKPQAHAGLAQTLQNYLAATAAGDNFASFSERQDSERAEELERVANKLAPSELTELNPIESPSLMHSAHQLHYQPDQLFPADIGSSPADSNSVIATNYHHSAPQLAGSGLSEPANSMSSYLQARHQSGSVDTVSELSQRAHDAKGGAPAAGLATATAAGGNDGARDDRVNSSPQVQVHRRTIETLSNQIAHADGNLVSANTLAVHQHRERSPPSAHDGRGAPGATSYHSHHQTTTTGGGSYAASLINVTAPMVLPLSATEAMEAALGDPAARQMMHRVGGGSLTLMQTGADQDQRYDSHAHTTTPPPHRSSYYVIPPPPSGSDQATGGSGLGHHLSIYSRAPAQNHFRPGTTSTTTSMGTTSSTTPAGSSSSSVGGDTQSPYELERERMRLGDGSYLQQQQQQPLPGSQQASGFRSPFGQYPASVTAAHMLSPGTASAGVPTPSSYLSGMSAPSSTASPQSSSSANNKFVSSSTPASIVSTTNTTSASSPVGSLNRFAPDRKQQQTMMMNNSSSSPATTNGFITSGISNSSSAPGGSNSLAGIVSTAGSEMVSPGTGSQQQPTGGGGGGGGGTGLSKRVFNLTRVEHISAECSNDLIRTIIIFNGTFKGIIYSSGYVRDSNCLYVNGTGKTRYDFSIKLNQCGTLGRQEIHPAGGGPGGDGLRRRDQVMWNTLSIQYNPIIEQEWDEHFRVSCEYGSDFWKTISFSPFNVETNTGSPVVFTVDPPQCQMEILKGHGMVGPRQETITGPVTVGDPLTLLIHMKSEKAGYDILVKNCVAHNGGQQKMQLIDTNGCVVNERFISPFRGTYNDNDLKHVTLYSYLKAFRFTGSPVLYLECEVHMCQSACPPQMCYWRRLSKRSTSGGHQKSVSNNTIGLLEPYADSSSLEEFDISHGHSMHQDMDSHGDDDGATQSQYVKTIRFNATASTTTETPPDTVVPARRQGRQLRSRESDARNRQDKRQVASGGNRQQENLSDSISLFQALEVRQEREEPNTGGDSGPASASQRLSLSGGDGSSSSSDLYEVTGIGNSGDASQLMCYQRIEIFAFLFTVASILLAAVSVTIGCYYRASSLRRVSLVASSAAAHQRALSRGKQRHLLAGPPPHPSRISGSLSLSSANLCYSPFSSSSVSSSTSSACSPTSPEIGVRPPGNFSLAAVDTCRSNYLLLDQNLHFDSAASPSHGRDGGTKMASNNCHQQQRSNINLNEIGAPHRFQHLYPTKRQPGL